MLSINLRQETETLATSHQYIMRHNGEVVTERLWADRWINFLYSEVRERTPNLFRALTSSRACGLWGQITLEGRKPAQVRKVHELLKAWNLDISEFYDDPNSLDSFLKLFTRRIRYWERRPMPQAAGAVVSPADSRVLLGSFARENLLFIKSKFFDYEELLGPDKGPWLKGLLNGDYAIFRLTPDKYHYVHTAVAGRVVDHYQIDGACHSCNPGAVINLAEPYSKNKRVVTILDTGCPGGSGVGLVAHIEIVALMVGDVEQRYSQQRYDDPQPVKPGMMLQKGLPKSLFLPGSSTVVLIFQPGRISFEQDIVDNQRSQKASSRFSLGFGAPLVETDLMVREIIGRANKH
jgi:phosphatidylserine decarboxylase